MDIKQLYRQLIMDHYRSPRNKGLIKDDNYLTVGVNNPSCGDEITIQVKLNKDKNNVEDIRHEGTGCSICCASASVASVLLSNKTSNDALELVGNFYELMKGDLSTDGKKELEDAAIFEGVSQFPARIKCATLAWIAIEKAINTSREKKED